MARNLLIGLIIWQLPQDYSRVLEYIVHIGCHQYLLSVYDISQRIVLVGLIKSGVLILLISYFRHFRIIAEGGDLPGTCFPNRISM